MSREAGSDKGIWRPQSGTQLGGTTHKQAARDTYAGPGDQGYGAWQGKSDRDEIEKVEPMPTRLYAESVRYDGLKPK